MSTIGRRRLPRARTRPRSPLSPPACACSTTPSSTRWSTTSSRPRGSRATPASGSSTSRRATAISDTSCSGARTAPAALRRLARKPHALHAPRRSRRSAPSVAGLEIAVRLSVFDTVAVSQARRRSRWRTRTPGTPVCGRAASVPGFGVLDSDDQHRRRAGRCARRAADARALGRPLDLRHGGQPLLQPARAAAGDVSAARRLRAAGGSAARRVAPDSRRRRS